MWLDILLLGSEYAEERECRLRGDAAGGIHVRKEDVFKFDGMSGDDVRVPDSVWLVLAVSLLCSVGLVCDVLACSSVQACCAETVFFEDGWAFDAPCA